jgi:hypothetical protein
MKHVAVSHCVQMLVPPSDCLQDVCSISLSEEDTVGLLEGIQQLLTTHQNLFAEPIGLPPKREANHKIPLIPSAQPVKGRPYRYSPV